MIAAILAALRALVSRGSRAGDTQASLPITRETQPRSGLTPVAPAELIRATVNRLWSAHRVPNGKAAEALMLAIGLQESRFKARDQIVQGKAAGQVGPATGYWQFERGGGVAGVMSHHLTADIARKAASDAGVPFERDAIWRHFATPAGDELAATFARLLLFTDPRSLPPATVAGEDEAWSYYVRNWRPGKPHRASWGAFWRLGVA